MGKVGKEEALKGSSRCRRECCRSEEPCCTANNAEATLQLRHVSALQTDKFGAQKTFLLEAGASETLRVTPVPKRLRTVAPGKGTWTERWGTAINLHFEGNWMPLLVSCTCGCAACSKSGIWSMPADTAFKSSQMAIAIDKEKNVERHTSCCWLHLCIIYHVYRMCRCQWWASTAT